MGVIVRVIVGVMACNYAGNRLCERAVEVGIAVVGKKTVTFHNLVRNYDVLRVAADEAVGITGSFKTALVSECRLNCELVAGLVFILPFFANLKYFTAELVADNSGILCYIVGNALVRRALKHSLVS